MSSMVNFSGLESVLRDMEARMGRQDAEIARLRGELRGQPGREEMDALKRAVDERLDAVEERLDALERAAAESAESVLRTRAHMNELLDLVESKADGERFAEAEADLRRVAAEARRLADDKADKSRLEDTVAAQQRGAQKLVAMEGMMATKIDRTEVPLLRAAASKVSDMADFVAGTKKRVRRLEEEARRLAAQKEDRQASEQRVQRLADTVQSKVDHDWLREHVVGRLNHIDKAVGLSSRVRDFVAQYERLPNRVALIESRLRQVQRETEQARKSQLEDAEKVADGALRAIEEHMQEVEACKDSLHEIEKERRRANQYLAEVKTQMSSVRDSHTALDKKVGVTLRFIDWFTDARRRGDVTGVA